MARPQFSPTSGPTQSRRPRIFSLSEANKSLPLVARIVKDIVQVHNTATHLRAEIDTAQKSKRVHEAEERLEVQLQRLHELIAELTTVGCEIKDCATGLVDFVGRHQSRDVYLCWKLGEERINYWHELHAGFAGRQPVSVLEESL